MGKDLSQCSDAELLKRLTRAASLISDELAIADSSAVEATPEVRTLKAEILRRLSIPRLFDKPQGPAKLGPFTGLGGLWSIGNRAGRLGTEQDVVCQGCGTVHSGEPGVEKVTSDLGGVTIVDACCGAWIDLLYVALGKDFCLRMLAMLRDSFGEHAFLPGKVDEVAALVVRCVTVGEVVKAEVGDPRNEMEEIYPQ